MPCWRLRMSLSARPALTRQRSHCALVAQRWSTSSLRSSATRLRRRRRRILHQSSSTGAGTLCPGTLIVFAPIGQATTALASVMASQSYIRRARHAADASRFIQPALDPAGSWAGWMNSDLVLTFERCLNTSFKHRSREVFERSNSSVKRCLNKVFKHRPREVFEHFGDLRSAQNRSKSTQKVKKCTVYNGH